MTLLSELSFRFLVYSQYLDVVLQSRGLWDCPVSLACKGMCCICSEGWLGSCWQLLKLRWLVTQTCSERQHSFNVYDQLNSWYLFPSEHDSTQLVCIKSSLMLQGRAIAVKRNFHQVSTCSAAKLCLLHHMSQLYQTQTAQISIHRHVSKSCSFSTTQK